MTDDLIARLRALSRQEHSDYSIGDEAADALEAAQWQPIDTAAKYGRLGSDWRASQPPARRGWSDA